MAGRKKKSETEPKPEVALDRSFAPRLRYWRTRRGLSQEALADLAEVHRTEVGLLENAERAPGFNVITKLAGALKIDPGELFKGATFVPGESEQGFFTYDEPKPDPG